MYLKELELFGFKTFADRTRLRFGPGVTAIVGPNGSGKSNIADAILFVLGEQSSKSIRTNHLADVIFNGNDDRKAMGIAEITLVLDNHDGALAIPYQEVAVTRRAHRNGDSDYLINRTKCRLRDIQELFLDTGLGQGTYSMIGQREVDRLLSLRAEDRRSLFEEAAGTAKYRARRNEALRKLEMTQGHLTRIHDIHTEVQGQLEPLRKQAEKAHEYRGLISEVRELSISILVAEATRATEAIGRCEHEAFVVRTDLERFETEAAQLEERLAEWRDRRAEAERLLEEARRTNGRIQGEVSRHESAIAVARERLQSCGTQTTLLEREAEEVSQRLVQVEGRQAALESVRDEARAKLEALEPTRQERLDALEAATAEFDELAATLQDTGRQRREAMQKRAAMESAHASLRAQRRELDGRLHEAEEAIKRLAGQESAEQARLARSEEELVEFEDREQAASTALEAARKSTDEARARLEALFDERQRTLSELGGVDARLASLEEIEKSGAHLPRGVQAALDARGDGKLAGIVGTVADVIGVPPEYERAMSAALGEWSRALVVETLGSAWNAIRHLRDERAGYAVMLPIEAMRAEPAGSVPEAIAQVEGFVGRASDLVSFHPSRRALLDRLLGDVVVVRDLAAAERVAPLLRGGAVVALTGERLGADGAVSGGSEPTAAEDPVSLASARDALIRKREDAQIALDNAEDAIAEARLALEGAKTEVAECERAYQECVAEIQKCGTRAAVTQERLKGLRAQRDKLEGERNQTALNQAELDRKIAAAAEELEAFAGPDAPDPEFVEETLAQLARKRDEARRLLADVQLKVGELSEHAKSAEADLAALPTERERSERRLEEIRSAVKELKATAQAELERVAVSEKALQESKAEGQQVLEELKGLSDQRLEAVNNMEEADRLAKDARAQLPDLRAALSAHEVKRARAEELRATVQARLSEEFEITLSEAERAAVKIDNLSEAQGRLRSLRARLTQMGEVNTGAEAEHQRLAERERFLAEQKADLETARDNLREIIAEIDNATKVQFLSAFNTIAEQFQKVFRFFFAGGQTQLVLTDPDNLLETGVEVRVKPPGRARQNLLSLSGGERAITAISLLFAMLRVRPSPFCVLDEIDAPLDEANTERFAELLRLFTDQTQFLVITHAPGTMQGGDRLYGVTMQERGVSCCLSIALEDAEDVIEGRRTKGRDARDVLYAGRGGEDLDAEVTPDEARTPEYQEEQA